jgi:hypothetical protein
MTLPRVSAAAVAAGQALDRADTPDELEAAWARNGCDAFRGVAGRYLRDVYRQVCARHRSNAEALRLARAS